jgi:hypothetical protein
MKTQPRAAGFIACMLCLLVAACAGQKEPAQKIIADIDAVTTAASTEAAKYIPAQLNEVQGKFGALKAAFDKQDYATVIAQGPEVLGAAQSLATAAAAKKDEILKSLNDDWTRLATLVPGEVTAVQARLELLSKKGGGKKRASGIDVDAANAEFSATNSLWSKAQAAFAAGNLDEAVSTANSVKSQLDAEAAELKLELPAAAQASNGAGAT